MRNPFALGTAVTCFIGALLFASTQPFFAACVLTFGIGIGVARKISEA